MASHYSSENLIAERYASALYDLSSEKKCIDEVLKNLIILEELISSNIDLKLLIKSPLINSNEKLKILERLIKENSANDLTLKFLRVLSLNKRFANLINIIARFKNINAVKRGEILADIVSADQLSNDQKSGIKEKLKSIMGEKLLINYKVDKSIIGGLIVKVGSKMIDSSLASKINKLNIAMKGAQWK